MAYNEGSVKSTILALLVERATDLNRPRVNPQEAARRSGTPISAKGGYTGLSVLDIAAEVTRRQGRSVDSHNVTHALYDLRNRGYVKFNTAKSGGAAVRAAGKDSIQSNGSAVSGNGIPVRIQVTKSGMASVGLVNAEVHTPLSERILPIGGDLGARIVEGIRREVETKLVAEDIINDGRKAMNGSAHIHDVEVQGGTPVLNADEQIIAIVPDPEPVVREEPKVAPDDPVTRVRIDISKYPLISAVRGSEDRVREAIVLLRLAGQNSVADLAEESLSQRTPLELELAALVKEITEEPPM